MSVSFEGYVEKIVFRNEENGYTVLALSCGEDEITCVGTFPFLSEGEYIRVTGGMTEHPLYGEQLKVEGYEAKEPEDLVSMERYLGSGAIKGIGAALAGRIMKKFQLDAFRVIEEEPERLAEVKGISEAKARDIALQFEERREMRNAMMFLQQYGISNTYAIKIYQFYGPKMYEVLRENPYRLAEDINGIGFRLADEIAQRAGIPADSDFRIQAGILYVLGQAGQAGHVFLPWDELARRSARLLGLDASGMEKPLMDISLDHRVIVKETEEGKVVYPSAMYYMEMNCARILLDLNFSCEVNQKVLQERIARAEKEEGIVLDERQKTAILMGARHGVLVITGGPGTGKTTTIHMLLRMFEMEQMDILLAAPTGRAAKRMKETTGYEAQTIHRLLELRSGLNEEEGKARFERDEKNPLEADVIIIDEMSMVDISLFHALLKAVAVGTRLVLVGDVNQLPSVGPGNVLKDIIRSETFPVVMLSKVFRQAAESDIIVNSHKINRGEEIPLDNKSKDFFMLGRSSAGDVTRTVVQLVRDKMPRYVGVTPFDVQVLTPMRKGELGVERLNEILQACLNPPGEGKREREFAHGTFREGDKVMQVKNNYQLAWEVTDDYNRVAERGTGVFNGDCGVIREINFFAETILVAFDEGKRVEYRFQEADELELAYAITIHKSQGSEYPAVVIPILTGPEPLLSRNILYTAVTRAKSCVTLVGDRGTVLRMIQNGEGQARYSSLDRRIREMR